MQRRSLRLTIVLKVARRREEQAALQMQSVRRTLETESTRLRELVSYREEYESQMRGGDRRPRQAIELARLYQFVASLNDAANQQGERIISLEQNFLRSRQRWQFTRQRRINLEELIAKLHASEERERERKTQQNLDEVAAQRLSLSRRH